MPIDRKSCSICGSELHVEERCPFRPGDAQELEEAA